MTQLVFRSLIALGAFLFFGGHLPLPADGRALAAPRLACDADLATCRLGHTEFELGARSPLLAGIALNARGNPATDLKVALTDPHLVDLLDGQAIPDTVVAFAQMRLAAAASHFIDGVDAGRATRGSIER
ncbi:MAG: hypothetical protein WD034_03815 [Parvibaculum sp.]|uniref:hypothetical protein n=1 Tax=Parvibaculum sp. TaxID=2024848 RepID=UPI0034A00696